MSEISISFLAVSDLPIGARGGKGRPQDHRPSQPQPPLRDSSLSASDPLHYFTSQFREHGHYSKEKPCKRHGFAIFYDPVFTTDHILNYSNNANNNSSW